MIDMNAVVGARAIVGRDCHIGAGAVLAGVLEPPSAEPVVIEDGVLEDPHVDAVFGLHAAAELPAGTIGVKTGVASAGSDERPGRLLADAALIALAANLANLLDRAPVWLDEV